MTVSGRCQFARFEFARLEMQRSYATYLLNDNRFGKG
jgi:hypothetical protein